MDDGETDVRTDALLGGRLALRQPARGHRAGTDAVLLVAAAPAGFAGQAADLGAGVGTVGIALALREPGAAVTCVELDPALCGLARENTALNGVAGRVTVVCADILAPPSARQEAGLLPGTADLVVTNPPFDDATRGRASPDPARRLAHRSAAGDLEAWVMSAADLLRTRGLLVAIVRADGIGRVLGALRPAFGGITLRPVHPRAGSPASRLLVRASRGSRAPDAVLPGLVLHAEDGHFTPQAEALHRGETTLPW